MWNFILHQRAKSSSIQSKTWGVDLHKKPTQFVGTRTENKKPQKRVSKDCISSRECKQKSICIAFSALPILTGFMKNFLYQVVGVKQLDSFHYERIQSFLIIAGRHLLLQSWYCLARIIMVKYCKVRNLLRIVKKLVGCQVEGLFKSWML